MKGDFSRNTFQAAKHYSGVLMQQGRVSVDADWNEQQAIHQHRVEVETRDVIGGCGTSSENNGFALTVSQDGNLHIGPGRYYVDGILCENEADDVTYATQPYLPNPPDLSQTLSAPNSGLALLYLDVWKRHITALDDSYIKERALGGPDTATRIQTVWQLKALPVALPSAMQDVVKERVALSQKVAATRTAAEKTQAESSRAFLNQILGRRLATIPCSAIFPEWDSFLQVSAGLLNARTQPVTTPDTPCDIPPGAGYQLLENQLYRVEVHLGSGDQNGPTFKWSRENGSVVTLIEAISGTTVTVQSLGPDEVLGFDNGQWVEIIDDEKDLKGLPGEIVQIDSINPGTRTITMKTAPSTPFVPNTLLKLRRWDQSDGSAAGIPITLDWQRLEGGIEVQFSKGTYKTGDYWLIPARTADGDIEWPPYQVPNTNPEAQPALGIQHHYCRVGSIWLDPSTNQIQVTDCRAIFAPLVQEAMHVVNTNWVNDDLFALALLEKDGLRIIFDAEPLAASLTGATVIVTLEIPAASLQASTTGIASSGSGSYLPRGPFLSFILDGSITAASTIVNWRWNADEAKQLGGIFEALGGQHAVARLRVTLKGHTIWSEQQHGNQVERLYLDGQTFGFKETRADGKTPRIALSPTSGGFARASDFESWCYITTQTTFQVKQLTYEYNEGHTTQTGTVTFPPAPDPAKPTQFKLPPNTAVLSSLRLTVKLGQPADTTSLNATGRPNTNIYLLFNKTKIPLKASFPDASTIVGDTGELRAGSYQLVILGDAATDGSGATPLKASDGTLLDGDYNGQPGGNFVFPFEITQNSTD